MELKNIIADIRKKNDISQEEMAKRLFVTRQAISRWENGDTCPSLDTLKLISKEFGVDANTLIGLPENAVCQSCGMPLKSADDLGTGADGAVQTDYCGYCFQNGGFTSDRTVEEMIEINLQYLDHYNKETGSSYSIEEARAELTPFLLTLKRWHK